MKVNNNEFLFSLSRALETEDLDKPSSAIYSVSRAKMKKPLNLLLQ